MNIVPNKNEKLIMELNSYIHHDNQLFDYHMKHIQLVKRYALLLNQRLQLKLDNRKLTLISLAHDILKERSLDPNKPDLKWRSMTIPQDLNRYVRTNLDILEKFDMDDYFNSSCQLHALSAGIFMYKEMNITDPELIYPVMFHSCPIISVYETLPLRTRNMVDVIMLADKLSSNYLRINLKKTAVRVDLDQIVFGSSGSELNYSLGLYIARLISQGKNDDEQSKIATEYYFKKLSEMNPFIFENYTLKKLGGSKIWPERRSQVWKMH